MNYQKLTKKERKELARQPKQQGNTKTFFIWVAILIGSGLTIAGLFWLANTQSSTKKPVAKENIVSEKGIHWHPYLEIYIKSQKQTLPDNLGIGSQYASNKWYDPMMRMTDVHTHDSSGTIHWEVMDNMTPVTKDHVRLVNVFDIWGKTFNSKCIFDNCNGPKGTVKMTVNGEPNNEFENYLVHDKDIIVIRYE